MPEYLIVDGPLMGETLVSGEVHEPGELVEVELVDLGHWGEQRFTYRVESSAAFRRAGRLRHVGAELTRPAEPLAG